MPEKNTSQSATEALIDLRALEMEIDKEIDACWYHPVIRSRARPMGQKTTWKTRHFSRPIRPHRKARTALTQNLGPDFDEPSGSK